MCMIVGGCENTGMEVGIGKERTKIGSWKVKLGRGSGRVQHEVISKVCFEIRTWDY